MKISSTSAFIFCFLILISAGAAGTSSGGGEDIQSAWAAWEDGDVAEAERIAAALSETDEGWHVLFLCALVKGKYESALEKYGKIAPSYKRLRELNDPVVYAYLHLRQFEAADRFARSHTVKWPARKASSMLAKRPLNVVLDGITEVPFAPLAVSEHLPGFAIKINGEDEIAHLDTGGAMLYMGPHRARKLKIKSKPVGIGLYHGGIPVPTFLGTADSFQIGDARLENVPVAVLPSLVGQQDFIIFGTNLLEPFLATIDYPHRKMILSPRNNPELRRRHLKMLGDSGTEIPFYLWGDHYMFARGGVGEMRELNFFIDTGLYLFSQDERGERRQAAFRARSKDFQQWGVDPALVRQKLFECPLPISLGPLEQSGHIVLARKYNAIDTLGGVRIDGLLSHAFIKNYQWTIDFDEMRYLFQ